MTTALSTDNLAGQFLEKFQGSLKDYAIRKYDHVSFLKSAMLAIADNNTLSECLKSEQGKRSLFNALRYASTTGLSLNPAEGKAALIGFKNKSGEMVINYQIMKNGLIDLALESGKVEFINADYVKSNDKFRLTKTAIGDNFEFEPALSNRGDIIGFYAALKLKDGGSYVKWFTKQEIEEFRDKYSSMFKFNPENSPWSKSFSGMGIKTVIKALLRSVRISDDVDNAIGSDDFFEPEFKVHGVTPEEVKEKLDDKDKKPPIKPQVEKHGALL